MSIVPKEGPIQDLKLIGKGALTIPYQAAKATAAVAGTTIGAANVVYGAAQLITYPFRLLIGLFGGGFYQEAERPKRTKKLLLKTESSPLTKSRSSPRRYSKRIRNDGKNTRY